PDHIVGIGRGGLVPAVYLSHAIGVPTVSCDQLSGNDGLVDTVLVRVAGWAAAGRRLLFVDDINDSGRTIAGLRATLAEAGAPAA
ncbi:phosphoribosyltransferase, partial [Clostridium perfringens]